LTKKLLITGASGFLGRYLCAQGLEQGYEVHAVGFSREVFDPVISNQPVNFSPLKRYKIDLTNPLAAGQLFAQVKPHAVIHAAAMAHPASCEQNPVASYRANVLATQYVSKCAAQRDTRLVFVSSEQVFSGNALIYRPGDATNPINVYGRHKAQAERLVQSLHPNAVAARLPLLYSFDNADGGFAPAMLQAFEKRKFVQAFTDEVRPPAHVDDVANALVKSIAVSTTTPPMTIVHLGGPEALTRYEMAVQLARQYAVNQKLPIESLDALVQPVRQSSLALGVARPARLWLESAAYWRQLGLMPRSWAQALAALQSYQSAAKG
jgi:dTDP-4-dehydrorhamnose reductase